MSAPASATLTSKLLRKDPSLPVYVVIPGSVVAPWKLKGTTVVEGTANRHDFGRRNLKAWGKGSDDWFLEFTTPFCKTAILNVGEPVRLAFHPADTSLPAELAALLSNGKIRALWFKQSERQQRESSEHVRAAKTEAARQRRAAMILGKLGGA